MPGAHDELVFVDTLQAMFENWERLWRKILKHELHPTLKMQ
jgi:hypothetical protein